MSPAISYSGSSGAELAAAAATTIAGKADGVGDGDGDSDSHGDGVDDGLADVNGVLSCAACALHVALVATSKLAKDKRTP
jgi:hypothetical protein